MKRTFTVALMAFLLFPFSTFADEWQKEQCALGCIGSCQIAPDPARNCIALAIATNQCSFPAAEAKELCMAHPSCYAVTCNPEIGYCQARSYQEAIGAPDCTSHNGKFGEFWHYKNMTRINKKKFN